MVRMHLEQGISREEEAFPFHGNFGRKLSIRTEWITGSLA